MENMKAGGDEPATRDDAKHILERMNTLQKNRKIGSKSEKEVWQRLHELLAS